MTLYDVVEFLSTFGIPLAGLVAFVLGLLTAFGAKKPIRILGLWCALTGLQVPLNRLTMLLYYLQQNDLIDEDLYVSLMTGAPQLIRSFTAYAASLAAIILLWLYLKKSYGAGPAPLIVGLAVSLGIPFISFFIKRFIDIGYDYDSSLKILLLINNAMALLALTVQVVFLVILIQHKNEEKNVPWFWVCYLAGIVISLLGMAISLAHVRFIYSDSYDVFTMAASFIFAFYNPIVGVYLFKSSRSVSAE